MPTSSVSRASSAARAASGAVPRPAAGPRSGGRPPGIPPPFAGRSMPALRAAWASGAGTLSSLSATIFSSPAERGPRQRPGCSRSPADAPRHVHHFTRAPVRPFPRAQVRRSGLERRPIRRRAPVEVAPVDRRHPAAAAPAIRRPMGQPERVVRRQHQVVPRRVRFPHPLVALRDVPDVGVGLLVAPGAPHSRPSRPCVCSRRRSASAGLGRETRCHRVAGRRVDHGLLAPPVRPGEQLARLDVEVSPGQVAAHRPRDLVPDRLRRSTRASRDTVNCRACSSRSRSRQA